MDEASHDRLRGLLLQEPGDLLRRLFESAHVALEVADASGRVEMVNPAWEGMTGYLAEEAVGRLLEDLVHSSRTDPSVYAEMNQALAVGLSWTGTYLARRKDGSTYTQHTTMVPSVRDGQVFRVLSIKSDLSNADFLTAAEALELTRTSMVRDRFRRLMNAATDAMLIGDWESARFIEVNNAACEMFRVSRDHLRTLTGRDLTPPESSDLVSEASALLHSSGSAYQPCIRHRRFDGTLFWAELKVDVWESNGEKFTLAIIRDITDRIEQELALDESQGLFRAAFEYGPIGIAIFRDDGVLASANPAFCEMLGREESWLLGRVPRDFTHPDDVAAEALQARRVLSRDAGDYSLKKRFLHRDGQVVHTMMHVVRADIRGEGHFVAQVVDLTEMRRTQRELERSTHLAALGRMAAAVAHDVNNPAAFVRLNLAEISARLGDGELDLDGRKSLQSLLRDCVAGVDRIGDIVRELQNFDHGTQAAKQKLDLTEVIRLSCRLASHEVRHRAKLTVATPAHPIWVEGSPSKLGQVVTNLVINAGKAIGDGNASTEHIQVSCELDGAWVTVAVSDSGPGLPEEKATLFEPFVSGTSAGAQGLGLWICSEIVTQHNGSIAAENLAAGGARFTVQLPSVDPPDEVVPPSTTPAAAGRVLVIDDEPAMLRAYQRVIGRVHDVIGWTKAAEALTAIGDGERYDAIICDMMMPGMNGAQFFERLENVAPGQAERVVFVTGGAITGEGASFLERHRDRVLRKPVPPGALLAAVRGLVEAPDGPA